MSIQQKLIMVRQKYTPFGGGERFLAKTLETLVAQGMQVEVLCRKWQGNSPYSVKTLKLKFLTRTQRDRHFCQLACEEIALQPEAIVQSHERIPCCDIYRAGEGTHREWLNQRQRKRGMFSKLLDSISPYHRYVLKAETALFNSHRLQKVICNSQMVADEIQRHYGLGASKIEVIYNGVDQHRFSPENCRSMRDKQRTQLKLTEATTYLFVGSGYERKGLNVVLTAMAGLNDSSQLLVVGKDKHQDRFKKQAKQLGLAGRVRFLGAQEDVFPFYAAADVFVLPTLYDPFPNVVLEALACALPVITSTKCGAVDIIEDEISGLICDALDIDALRTYMQKTQNSAYSHDLGNAGMELVKGFYFEKMSTLYQSIYNKIAA